MTLYLTREQVRLVDRRAIEEYHIPGIVLMENAAIGAASVAGEILGTGRAKRAMILCGGGNNGGDGLAIARHLQNAGIAVEIGLCIDPAGYKGDALINWEIVRAMKLPSFVASPDAIRGKGCDLVIDAIFGTGLSQAPRSPFDRIAAAVNSSGKPVLAIDLPSGLDCDTGRPLGACIRATRTVTLVAMKAGFAHEESRQWTGQVSVAGIGCPVELVEEIARST